jgi:glycosyltransferase involved in cell wall biosynthesis
MAERAQPALKVTVIATVLNEESNVAGLIDSLAHQTRIPDEVIISDGGSQDDTVERIHQAAARCSLKVEVLQLAGSNISEGRNAAVGRATGNVIAVTDAGVRLKPTWLEQLTAPFEMRPGRVDVVSGFFEPDPTSTFEVAMGATALPTREEINPALFLPSSRSVAFTREAWRRAGGYPEWLDYCEDVVFDLALRRNGCVFAWAPEAVALFRPRSGLLAYWKQYYRYARGDGKAGLWPGRHAIRYGSYLAGLVLLLAARRSRGALLLLGIASYLHVRRPYHRLMPWLDGMEPDEKLQAISWVPILRLVGDLAKMAGYPAGLLWRMRQRRSITRLV